jgi:uncharacterized protein (DUF427 family)
VESSKHVRVVVNGEVVTETRRPKVLFETALLPCHYVRQEDVRTGLLVPT